MIKLGRMKWALHVACFDENRNAYRFFVRKSKAKRLVIRPKHRWKDKIKVDFREIELGSLGWINLTQDRAKYRGSCGHGNKPSDSTMSWSVL
jgi:hypothetical protein